MKGSCLERSSSKREMREKLLQLREGLPVFARQEKSREIARRLVDSSEFEAADTIHFYLSNGTEVQTDAIILETLRLKKRVIVPVVHPEDRLLSFSEIAGLNPNQMQAGPFGIRQPRSPFIKEATSREIDLWIVPGLGFDIQGNRIGYGGGYYDRVLGRVKRKIIGLAFECQVVASIPVGEQDSPVHKIITEQRIINCR
ncbi:MAG: 5-formyltetrahydrofolate cyclo-ligase [Nitrospiria bacterium]